MKTLITTALFVLVANSFAFSTYYPTTFIENAVKGKLQDDALKAEIFNLLTSDHQKNAGAPDTLGCKAERTNCYRHIILGYSGARKVLFGRIHLEKNDNGYFIRDVYCHKIFTTGNSNVGPNAIPEGTKINCEHTWPQSKFTRSFDIETQKSDLNHLYATDSKANSVRGNFNFADVANENGNLNADCSDSKSGSSVLAGGDNYFEPPTEHKGNVARALFYFAVRYKMSMDDKQEETLRRWNDLDPVDDAERARNEIVNEVQGNRNPFIDFPQLANYIRNF